MIDKKEKMMSMFFQTSRKTCSDSVGESVDADLPRLAFVVSFCLQAIIVNAANAGLFGGLTNAQVADKYPTLMSPAKWAFAIWGLIYMWETVACVYVFTTTDRSQALGYATNFFVLANAAQALWSLAFAREFLILANVLLFVIVFALGMASEELRESTGLERALVAIPIGIHFGWTSVAALLNVNLVLVRDNLSSEVQIAAAFASLYAAIFACLLSLTLRGRVSYVVPVAWAFVAIYFQAKNSGNEMTSLAPTHTAISYTSLVGAFVLGHFSLAALAFDKFIEPLS